MRSAYPFSVVALALAVLACGGQEEQAQTQSQPQGLRVVVESPAPFARSADFASRLDSTIEAALSYWGGTWADLDGTTLTFTDAPDVACNGGRALGCYSGGSLRVTTQDPTLGTHSCVEATVLVHEVGHAVIGDYLHEDPRWMMMDDLAAALAGRPGYGEDGAVGPCVLYVSIWRHPLGSP